MGHTLKIFIFGSLCILFGSCYKTEVRSVPVPKNYFLYQSGDGYSISVPLGYKYSEPAPSGKYYYFGYPANNAVNLSTIEFYVDSSTCSPSRLGNLQAQSSNTNGTRSIWAKMLLLDAYDRFQDTFCQPFTPDCTDRQLFEGKCKSTAATYAFCSQKDGTTVAICINQMTDNPALAQQIFETFRWTQ
jgi:hypothetical protein